MVVASVILALGLVEAGMRYWIRGLEDDAEERVLYDPVMADTILLGKIPHHYEGYILRPGWTSPDGLNRFNSLGYRGEEVEIPKPAGVYRIIALGGSTTYGSGVKDWRDAYPAQLGQVLREDYGYTNVEVVNGGVAGHNSWETLANLAFRALDLEPDLVILYQNTNDVQARIVPPSAYRGDNSGLRKVWDTEAVELATSWPMRVPSVLWRYTAVNFGWFGIEPVSLDMAVSNPCTGRRAKSSCLGMTTAEALEANPPIYYERNVRNIVAVAQVNGVEVLLLTWAYSPEFEGYASNPEYQAAFAEHNEIIRRLADELDIYFYDFASEMPPDAKYWSDGRHMTVEGNRLRAELIAAYIDEVGVIPKP
jgi:lysophospholipase L1-like esterase